MYIVSSLVQTVFSTLVIKTSEDDKLVTVTAKTAFDQVDLNWTSMLILLLVKVGFEAVTKAEVLSTTTLVILTSLEALTSAEPSIASVSEYAEYPTVKKRIVKTKKQKTKYWCEPCLGDTNKKAVY